MEVKSYHLFTLDEDYSAIDKIKELGIMNEYIEYFEIEDDDQVQETLNEMWDATLGFIADHLIGAIIHIDTEEGAEFYRVDRGSFFNMVFKNDSEVNGRLQRYVLQFEVEDDCYPSDLRDKLKSNLDRFNTKTRDIKRYLLRSVY